MLPKILKIDSSTREKQEYSMCHDSQRGEKEPSARLEVNFLVHLQSFASKHFFH